MYAEHAIGVPDMGHLSRVPSDGSRYFAMNETEAKRWCYLFQREQAGTITAPEMAELQQLNDVRHKESFETCPVCSGAFSFFEVRDQFEDLHCPRCEIGLLRSSGDILPHLPHEVDPSVPAEHWLGEFSGWYYPVGCKSCHCWILDRGYYPKHYSCCPGVIQLALKMATEPCHATAAAGFLYEHQATFVNSLRGEFFACYDLELLRKFVDNHACSELACTIQSIIDDRAR